MAVKCKATPPEKPEEKGMPGSALRARIRKFYDDLLNRAGLISDAQQIAVRLLENDVLYTAVTADISKLKNYNKLENMMATALGFKSWLWQAMNRKMTQAGELRRLFIDRMRTASQLISLAASYKNLPTVRQLYKELKLSLPNLDERVLQEILYDHVVLSFSNRSMRYLDSPVVFYALKRRYLKHVQRLKDLGLTNDQLVRLNRLGKELVNTYEELRWLAATQGLEIEALKNGGYLPLRFYEEAERYFRKLTETSGIGFPGNFISSKEFFLRSRISNLPVIARPLDFAKLMNMQWYEVMDMATEPGKVSAFLNKHLSEETIHKLAEIGVLDYIPAISDELKEFFAKTFDTPVEYLADWMMLDPVTALEAYTRDLQNAVEKSALVKTMLTELWDSGAFKMAYEVNFQNNKDYVRMGASPVINELLKGSEVIDDLQNIYVHRTVAAQVEALLEVNQSWSALGQIGNAVEKFIEPFTKFFSKSLLLGAPLEYIRRVLGQDLIALYAATGGGLDHLPVAMAEVFTFFAKRKVKEVFKDVHAKPQFTFGDGSKISLKEAFIRTFLQRGAPFVTATGERVAVGDFFTGMNWQSFQRFLFHQKIYAERFGSVFTGKKLAFAELIKEMSKRAFSKGYAVIAASNMLIDFSARWAAIRQLLYKRASEFKNFDDLLRYTDEFFQINEDVGTVGKMINAVGRPFASFAMVAPGAMLRYALINPWRFSRTLWLYSKAIQGNELTEAEMEEWRRDDFVIVVGRDPLTGKQFTVSPGDVDFYLDSSSYLLNIAQRVARAFGVRVGSVKNIVEQEKNPMKPIMDTLEEIASNTYFSGLFALFGVDPNNLREIENPEEPDTLLGFPISKQARLFLTRTFPLLKFADEKWLPKEIVGQKGQTDPTGYIKYRQSTPGWLGYTPSQGGKRDPIMPNSTLGIMFNAAFGLSLSELDPAKNIVTNYEDFDKLRNELVSYANKINERLIKQPELGEGTKMQLIDMRDRALHLAYVLEVNKALVDQLARDRGYPPPKALEWFRRQENKITEADKLKALESFIRKLEEGGF